MNWAALGQSFESMFSIELLLLVMAGIFIGIIFGAIPGLTGAVAIVLFMPFTGNMNVSYGVIFLTCMFCGAEFGGSISAILIGTPGTNSATCTMSDGYPLAKRGQAKRALLTALYASVIGGILSALALLFLSPLIATQTLLFGPSEQFAIAVFGLSIIVSLSGKSLLKGFFAAALGIILSLVGNDQNSGMVRLTFGSNELYSGIALVALFTGMFALTTIVEKISVTKGKDESPIDLSKSDSITLGEFLKYKWTALKGAIIGIVIGAIPGTGTGIASFMSYNSAKNNSKHPEEYGNGSLEGITAAESANNGVTSASLIPLLTLGIPGAPQAAVLMGAFTMQGIAVGPMLFKDEPVMVYTIMIGLIFANIMMLIQGKYFSNIFAKITKIPNEILVPLLIIVSTLGVYSMNNSYFDLFIYIGAGLAGYILVKLGVPMVPLVLGFVLGKTMERNLRGALAMTQGDFVGVIARPIVAVVLLITVFTICWPFIKRALKKRKEKKLES